MSGDATRRAVKDAINGDMEQFSTPVERATLRALHALATQQDNARCASEDRSARLESAVNRLRNSIAAAVTSIGVAVAIAAILAALSR